MEQTMDTLVINIQSSTDAATKSIGKLISSLKKLQDELGSTIGTSKGLSSLKNISNNIKTSARKSQTNTPQGTAGLNEQLDKLGVKLDDFQGVSAINSLTGSTERYKNSLGQTLTITKKMKNGLEQYGVSVKTVNTNTDAFGKKLNTINKILNSTQAKFAAMATSMWMLAKNMTSFVKQASAETEAMNLFVVTMGTYAEQGLEWVEKFSNALYLDPVSVLQYMGSFNSLIKGLGVGAQNAYLMSQNLTQLVYDLSSFKNISIDVAYEKLMSGISGELEPLRNVGVAMSEATLQTLAYELGLGKLVRNMTEAEKAQLRYIQIMRSSTEWQMDMGRTLITPANALRVTQQQFVQLGRAIGKVFIPIVMELLPYVIALSQVLTDLANKIASALGYEILDDIDYSNLGKISGGIGDIGDNADETAKKLNTMLAPFDELNVVQKQTESNGGLTGFGGDLGVALPEYDALGKLTDALSENVEKAKENLDGLLKTLLAIGGLVGAFKVTKGFYSFIKLLDGVKIGKGVKDVTLLTKLGGAGTLATIFASVLTFVVALGIELPKLSTAFDDVVYNGKKFSDVSDEFGAFDATLLSLLAHDNMGKLTLSIFGMNKILGYFNNNALESGNVLDQLDGKISKTTKNNLEPLITQFEKLNTAIVDIDLTGIVEQKDIDTIKQNLEKIVMEITNKLDARKNTDLKNLQPLAAYMNDSVYASIVEKTNEFYENQKKSTEDYQNKINEILKNAEGRELVETELAQINEYRTKMLEIGVQTASEKSDEYYIIMNKLKNNLGKLSVEQASEYIQQAIKTRDETIKAAEEQYDKVVAEAGRLKDANVISDEEYRSMVGTAIMAKDDTIKAANDQYNEIYNTTKNKLGDTSKYIDEKTGEIKSNWEVFTTTIKDKFVESLDKIKSKAETKLDEIKNKFTEKFGTPEDWKAKFWAIVDGAQLVLNDLKSRFENWSAKIKVPNLYWDNNDVFKTTGIAKKALEFLNLPTSIPKLKVAWYQDGGYPSSGELFFANENGVPEMVGRIGNQTAVANNDQITASITTALLSALDQYNFGGGNSPTTIYIGNRKVYEGYGDYVADENDRYGTNMIKI